VGESTTVTNPGLVRWGQERSLANGIARANTGKAVGEKRGNGTQVFAAENEFSRQLKGGQPVCRGRTLLVGLVLIFPQKVTRQPHVAKRKSPSPPTRVASEPGADVTEHIQNTLSSLGAGPVHSEKPKNSDEGSATFVQSFLSSLFPGFASYAPAWGFVRDHLVARGCRQREGRGSGCRCRGTRGVCAPNSSRIEETAASAGRNVTGV